MLKETGRPDGQPPRSGGLQKIARIIGAAA
jgi:hypothetical protein